MTKIMKMTQVWQGATVLLMVAAVSNTRTPLATEAPCIQEDLEVLMSNFTSWISNLTSSHYDPTAVAASILNYCDTSNDSALDQTELVTCVHNELAASISARCFPLVFKKLDENSDGVVDLAELTALISAVSGQRRDQQRRNTVHAKRVDDSRIRSGFKGEILKKDRSNSGSFSGKDVLREERDDSSDDSDSNSREDELRKERDDSSDSGDTESSGDDSDSNSREDELRKERDDSSDSGDTESSGDDSDSNSRVDVLK